MFLPEEIIACIFKKGNLEEISFERINIQQCVYLLKKDPSFSSILKTFRFSGSPVAPFSETLDAAMFNLQLGKKLKRLNPDLITYKISDEFGQYFDDTVAPKLDDASEKLMTQLATRFKSLLEA